MIIEEACKDAMLAINPLSTDELNRFSNEARGSARLIDLICDEDKFKELFYTHELVELEDDTESTH